MKHLFYIHSHTTYLTAVGVIESLQIQAEEIIFVISRNYKNTFHHSLYKEIDLSLTFKDSMDEPFKFWKLNKLVKYVDSILEKEVNDKYLAYLPHVGVFLPQVLATNKNCRGIRFIEEGSCCYSPRIEIKRYPIKEIIKILYSQVFTQFKRFWFTDFVFYHEFLHKRKEVETELFCISQKAYEYLNYKKHIVQWPTIKIDDTLNQQYPIFIFEAAIEQKYAEKEIYLDRVKKVIESESEEVNYIKFHPAQHKANIEVIHSHFKRLGKQVIDLPNDVPFELVILNQKDLKIIGFGSSLLLYAKSLGHQVKSFESLLLDDPKYKEYKKVCDFVI